MTMTSFALTARDGASQRGSAVEVSGLSKTYANGTVALDALDLAVADGETFGLLGPNGAGKSTTIGILTTLVTATAGTAVVAGIDVRRDPVAVRSRTGVVFQDSVLDNEFSVGENLRLHARLWGLPPEVAAARIGSLTAELELSDRIDHGVRTLSGGLRRRVEIARGLLAQPEVLFLDEPTVGLDPTVRAEIWRLIGDLRDRHGVTVILTTHYLEEAEAVCDRVAILHRGRLVAVDRPAALIDQLGPWVVELRVTGSTDEIVADLTAAGLVQRPPLLSAGGVLSLTSHQQRDTLAATVGRLQGKRPTITAATVRPTTLSDVYHHLTGAPPTARGANT
jgi:ABC-2 type transport system ATP-binding protein